MTRSEQGRDECNAGERSAIWPFSKPQRRTGHPRALSAVTAAGPAWSPPENRATLAHASATMHPTVLIAPSARCGWSASGFRNADVAGYLVLGNLIDDQFQWAAVAALMEEDRLIHRHILLVNVDIIDDQGDRVALLVEVRAAKFDHKGANLLRFILRVNGELDVLSLTKSSKLFYIFVVAGDQRPKLAARHFQVALSGFKIRADPAHPAIHGLDVISRRFCGQLRLHGAVHFGYLLLALGLDFRRFRMRLLQVALREAELLGHHTQVALQPGVGSVALRLMLLYRCNLVGEIRLQRLDFVFERLLDFLSLR